MSFLSLCGTTSCWTINPSAPSKVGTGREHTDQRGLLEPSSHVIEQKSPEHVESALAPATARQARHKNRP